MRMHRVNLVVAEHNVEEVRKGGTKPAKIDWREKGNVLAPR